MKEKDFSYWCAITADQRGSRRASDRVPEALDALRIAVDDRMALPFERTAGDEIQGLTGDPSAVVDAVLALTRLPDWRIGLCVGPVELPLPGSTREARGPAYVAAREAVESARRAPTGLALVWAPETVGARSYGDDDARQAETALILLRALVSRRTPEGWELMDVLDDAPSGKAAAELLGITPSAVSQRLARSGRTESERGAELATLLLSRAMRR
jgi:hypothetical protein